MGRQMSCKDVQEDVKCTVGIEIKVADETDYPTPDGRSPFVDYLSRFGRQTCGRRVCWADTTGNFCDQFAVSFGLFSQEVDFVLLVADENMLVC